MDDPKRLLATLNRSSLQRDNLAVYQVIKSMLQGLGELQTKTSAMPLTPVRSSVRKVGNSGSGSPESGSSPLTGTQEPPSNRSGKT